jgi:hypothetical protein
MLSTTAPWSLSTEKFFYFFMGLRKGEIRKQVHMMQRRHPADSPHRLARRFVAAQLPLSLLASLLLHAPLVVPAFGPALKLAGIATGSTVMIRLNMTLLLQIALLYGHDIDDKARLKEMAAIVAASGLASGTSLLPHLSRLKPYYEAILGGASVITVGQLIGEAAIRYYSSGSEVDENHSRVPPTPNGVQNPL